MREPSLIAQALGAVLACAGFYAFALLMLGG